MPQYYFPPKECGQYMANTRRYPSSDSSSDGPWEAGQFSGYIPTVSLSSSSSVNSYGSNTSTVQSSSGPHGWSSYTPVRSQTSYSNNSHGSQYNSRYVGRPPSSESSSSSSKRSHNKPCRDEKYPDIALLNSGGNVPACSRSSHSNMAPSPSTSSSSRSRYDSHGAMYSSRSTDRSTSYESTSSSSGRSYNKPHSMVNHQPLQFTMVRPEKKRPVIVPLNNGGYVLVPPTDRRLHVLNLNPNYTVTQYYSQPYHTNPAQ
ncbi:hypothetical protein BDQ17DRAFT_1434870 [Cyathus striatus]|nr:hypothetical protein BDQ17DRAFT_1434870 [Cyathus striatus]